jgi:hypothetical protein
MFFESIPILDLCSFTCQSFGFWGGPGPEIFAAVATHCPTIKRLHLSGSYNSPDTILEFIENCRGIEELFIQDNSDYEDGMGLSRSDFEAIVSLPRLNSLRFDCSITDEGVDALILCRGLKSLDLGFDALNLNHILPTIGRNLVCLKYRSSGPILDAVSEIIEHCPNLHMLDLGWSEWNDVTNAADVGESLKSGLKKLAKLKLNLDTVRLGTDWEGY